MIDGRLLRSKFRAFFSASESTRFTCKVNTSQFIIIDINTNPPVRGVICPDCLADQCRKSPGGYEIISDNAAYYFCIYCEFHSFFLPPNPLVSHAKIILTINHRQHQHQHQPVSMCACHLLFCFTKQNNSSSIYDE